MSLVQIDWDPSPKMLRNFGLIGLVAFAAFGALTWTHRFPMHWVPDGAITPVSIVMGAMAAFCGVFGLVAPALVKPIYLALTVVSYPIGFVLSYVIVSIMFFLVITPIAVVFRIFGRDPLNRKFDAAAATYWIERHPPETVKRYFRQF